MADAFTQVSSLASVGTTAHVALAYFSLRDEFFFDQVADVKPTQQTHAGGTVLFYIYDEMAEATGALTETVDPDAIAIADSTVTVTLVEQGNAVRTTAKARGTDLLELDRDAANLIGHNAGLSLDSIARAVLEAGSNAIFANGAANRGAIDGTDDVLGADEIAEAVAKLRGANVQTHDGLYTAYIHPDNSYDLRRETGAAGWAEPANVSDATRRWTGMVGAFNGARIIEAPRVSKDVDGGSGNVDVYLTLVVGRQALAKAHAMKDGYKELPQIIVGPQTDKLRRFNSLGWKWLGGYKRFREASIQRIECSSTIGAN